MKIILKSVQTVLGEITDIDLVYHITFVQHTNDEIHKWKLKNAT